MNYKEKYREIVPISDYSECKGCHTGAVKCSVVHGLHSCCPCFLCLVKTSCTDYCLDYQNAVERAAGRLRRSGKEIRVQDMSNKGYTVVVNNNGQKLLVTSSLFRWLTEEEKIQMFKQGVL